MAPVKTDGEKLKVSETGKNDEKKSLSRFQESNKAAALYTFNVTPNFFESSVSVEQQERPTNKRKSTRYTWPTFFPIAFGLQFKKLVNIFYIVTGILNFFKVLSVNSPLAVLIPVFCIMLLGVVKEFASELSRSREDKIVNATPVTRLDISEGASKDGKMVWETTCLAELKVGDIIEIKDSEQVPADCVLLQVKDNKPECFVKTAALDGERNLKPKLANPQISANFETLFGPNASRGKANLSLSCITPQKELYYFEGRMRACLPDEPEFKMNLSLNQFLHRGSYVENSGSVIAVVVYTGTDSKLILNLGKYVYKMSSFDKILNTIMVLNLLAAIVIALLTAIVSIVWWKDHEEHQYIYENFNSDAIYLIYTFRVYLIVNSFVPLDLLAMLEISKLMFKPMMEADTEMIIVEPSIKEMVGFKANTYNLPEELAQVEYIFCDKTGTLT